MQSINRNNNLCISLRDPGATVPYRPKVGTGSGCAKYCLWHSPLTEACTFQFFLLGILW